MNKPIRWSESKNRQLKRRHGIGFDEVLLALERGRLLDHRKHPNMARYGNQQQLVVEIDGYAIVVPYVDAGTNWFFKTLFPSRQATKRYIHALKKQRS